MVTAAAIVGTDMFEGVLIGLLLAVVKTAWETSHVRVDRRTDDARPGARARSRATPPSCGCRSILDQLEALPARPARYGWTCGGLRHLDHACRTALDTWIETQNRNADVGVQVIAPRPAQDDRPRPVPATE